MNITQTIQESDMLCLATVYEAYETLTNNLLVWYIVLQTMYEVYETCWQIIIWQNYEES